LGNEEIKRLALDEEIQFEEKKKTLNIFSSTLGIGILVFTGLFIFIVIIFFWLRSTRTKKEVFSHNIPDISSDNQILLFGEFKAINDDGKNISEQFTPKVKELFLFVLVNTLKNRIGALTAELNKNLWYGIDSKKVANNRAVTLNKLRKILVQFDQVEVISNNGYLQLKSSKPFFCDYIEAFKLCQIPEGMTKKQLETFYHFVKRGRLLKGINWNWLDDIRGFTGNQVIDNLLKLASIYKKEGKLKEIEAVAQRILDYDDLNEEAIYLQIWALQQTNSIHLAKFNFKSFCTKYQENMGEPFPMSYDKFTTYYSDKF
jgi:two-component SAPR family response regulator